MHNRLSLLAASALLLTACGHLSSAPQSAVSPAGTLGTQSTGAEEPSHDALDLSEGAAPLPSIGIDPDVFGPLGTQSAATPPGHASDGVFLRCRNEMSGAYSRFQTDPARTGPVNFIEGTAFMPDIRATNTVFPYLYLGGQPRQGRAADAGIYAVQDGAWIPVINVEGKQKNIARENGEDGFQYVYRLSGKQSASMRMSIPHDGALRLEISGSWLKFRVTPKGVVLVGDSGVATREILHEEAIGWKTAGEDQVFKVMTTIAFPGRGDFRLLSGNYAFRGSSWRELVVGQLEGASGKPWRRPLAPGMLWSACAQPADIVTVTPDSALPNIRASIKLRERAALALPSGSTFDLTAPVRQTVRSTLAFANQGVPESFVHYALTPLGREHTVKSESGVLAVGEQHTTRLDAVCGSQAGTEERATNLLYAVGETYDGSVPSALPGAQKGDLLYRAQPVTVRLTCTDPR